MPRATGCGGGAVLSAPAFDEGGFPFGSAERHLHSVPLPRALGVRWGGLWPAPAGEGPVARLHLPCRPALCTPDGAIDLRVVAAVLDQSGAPACYAARASSGITATLALQLDFDVAPEPGRAITVDARCLATDGASALVTGAARHEGGPVLARLSGRYVVGLGPGRASSSEDPPERRAEQSARHADAQAPAAASFDALLGLRGEADAPVLDFQPWQVGSVALPALHGGVVAAGLMSAAAAAVPADARGLKLTQLSLQYLRAGLAETTHLRAACVQAGRRAVHVSAAATQQGGTRQVATMQALFA